MSATLHNFVTLIFHWPFNKFLAGIEAPFGCWPVQRRAFSGRQHFPHCGAAVGAQGTRETGGCGVIGIASTAGVGAPWAATFTETFDVLIVDDLWMILCDEEMWLFAVP